MLNYDGACKALLAFMFSGKMGDTKGKLTCYSLLAQNETTFTFIAALDDKDTSQERPVIRYRVAIDRVSGQVSEPQLLHCLLSIFRKLFSWPQDTISLRLNGSQMES